MNFAEFVTKHQPEFTKERFKTFEEAIQWLFNGAGGSIDGIVVNARALAPRPNAEPTEEDYHLGLDEYLQVAEKSMHPSYDAQVNVDGVDVFIGCNVQPFGSAKVATFERLYSGYRFT
jgi:hypothetical protein